MVKITPPSNGPPGGFLALVVEPDLQTRRLLSVTLRAHGFRVGAAVSGIEASVFAKSRRPDLVLTELRLPDIDGIDFLRTLRSWLSSPLLVVSAREREEDKVRAFDAGCDDYLTKPFGTGELMARIRAALRHSMRTSTAPGSSVSTAGAVRLDRERHEVTVQGQRVKLTPLEYRLLDRLMHHAGKVVTQRQLLREIWGEAHVDQPHYLRVYMSSLRRKLESDPTNPQVLLTEQGVGYRLTDS